MSVSEDQRSMWLTLAVDDATSHGTLRRLARDAVPALIDALKASERNLDKALAERVPFAEAYAKPIRERAERAEIERDQAVHVAAKEVAEAIARLTTLKLAERLDALEAAIRDHRAQKADDRCIEDDDRLYAALGDGIKCDRRVGDKAEMLMNCARFITRRCEGGEWPSYAKIETDRVRLVAALREMISDRDTPARNSAWLADVVRSVGEAP